MNTAQTTEISLADFLEAICRGARIVDAHQNPQATIKRMQRYAETGAKSMGRKPNGQEAEFIRSTA